jgi:hypothetical protein
MLLGFLSHPQTVYPSYLTPPLSLNPSNLNMGNLGMGHGHPNGGLRISPQNMQQHHMQAAQNMGARHSPSMLPTTSSASLLPPASISTISPSNPSPSHSLNLRSPHSPSMSPDKVSTKSIDLSMSDGSEDRLLTSKENALNMTISGSSTAAPSDIRTNSIAALRIKAKEHLENINKNMTMV